MTMVALQVLWYFLIFLLIAGFFVLDGFDLGIGVLMPFVARSEQDKQVLRRAIGPIWDGNEVWLIVAGGALFAAFPAAYATTFSGFYLAVMLVLFGLIVRAVSFEFHEADVRWRGVWDVCFFLGSLLPALLLGVAVGNIFAGIPMDANGNYIGFPLFGLITPFTLLTGFLGLFMMLASGACWGALKAPLGTPLQHRLATLRIPLQIVCLILFIGTTIYALMIASFDMEPALEILRWVFAAVVAAALILSMVFSGAKNDLWAFLTHSAGSIALVAVLACSMFPILVVASADSVGGHITLMAAASSDLTLICMTVILCIGLPLVLLYHIVIYRTFRGRVELSDVGYGD